MAQRLDSEEEEDLAGVPECKCRVVRTLGQGTFGKVYLATATSPLLPTHVAIKSAWSEPGSSSSFSVDALLEEASFFDYLPDSPYLIRSYGLETICDDETGDPHRVNLYLEYAAAGSLEDRIRSSPQGLPETQVRAFTASILRGLHHLHHHHLVHCDLKPGNVLLVPSFRSSLAAASLGLVPKIADLGCAKIVGDPSGLRGTPMYMAPECVSHHIYEPPCDVWALGCIALELLTGQRPWGAEATASLSTQHIYHILEHDTSKLPTLPTHLSQLARDFLDKCLVRDPNTRWTAEMLLSHPFMCLSSTTGIEIGRLKRSRVSYDDDDDDGQLGLGSSDYIPLESSGCCAKRQKNTSEAAAGRLPSYISI